MLEKDSADVGTLDQGIEAAGVTDWYNEQAIGDLKDITKQNR